MLLINFCGCRSAKQGLFLCTILLSLLASGTSRYRYERPSRVVEIKQGRLQGTLVEVPLLSTVTSSSVKTQVEIYRGIPFAAPPVGSLRFMPPVTRTPWREIRSATRFGPVCPQLLPETRNETAALLKMSQGRLKAIRDMKPMLTNQTEDCLYLNVYSPRSKSTNSGLNNDKKSLNPVIVFIHGDSYVWGSGNLYDGAVLASVGQVVVVTLNYRLGILGFLNANTDGKSRHPSNLGILDQIAALHWVQENIANFGGDPRNVTLMGHGTGAACVHFLMTSEALPEGKLFHRVVLMSGSALTPWAVVSDPARATLQVASALNCTEQQLQQARGRPRGGGRSGGPDLSLLGCLRSVPLYQLMRAAKAAEMEDDQNLVASNTASNIVHRFLPNKSTWGPSFDGVVVHSFRRRMRDYLDRMARYELLFGVTTADATFALNNRQLEYGLEPEERNRILSDFVSSNYGLHQREIFAAIVNEYTDWQSAAQHPVNIRDNTLEALTDANYVAPIVETGDYHSSLNARSWFYVFDYQTKDSYYKQRGGCVHGEELNYIFGYPLLRDQGSGTSEADKKKSSLITASTDSFSRNEANLALSIIQFWSNFAATGNPNLSRKSSGQPYEEEWESYDPKRKKYISIGLKPRMKDHYRPQKMALWMNLIPDLQSAAMANRRGHSIKQQQNTPQQNQQDQETLLDYRLYNELLPFVPKLKNLDEATLNHGSTPASSEVLDLHGLHGNATPHGQAKIMTASDSQRGPHGSNSSYILQKQNNGLDEAGLSSYSTALSVTIAIGCSLLVLNVLIFTAVYYQRDRNRDRSSTKLDNSLLTCNSLSDHHSLPPGPGSGLGSVGPGSSLVGPRGRASLEEMTSISQYVERRPSDSNCLMQHTMAVASVTPPSGRRSLPDMHGATSGGPSHTTTPPAPPPPSMSTTVSVAIPRKSALKTSSNTKLIERVVGPTGGMGGPGGGVGPPGTAAIMTTSGSTFRTHLPPPEFADTSPPSNTSGCHFTLAEVQVQRPPPPPQHQPHSSFRTLPRPVNSIDAHNPPNTQTLPLKSNLKKSTGSSSERSGGGSGGGGVASASGGSGANPNKNTLQWSSDHHTGTTSTNHRQVSMEELRV